LKNSSSLIGDSKPSHLTRFGTTELYVSRLCQGTVFRSASDIKTKLKAIDQCIDNGVNFFDSSNAYGDAEITLGRGIAGKRDNLVICTKVHPFYPPKVKTDPPISATFTSKFLYTQVNKALRRLGTDYIDLYMLHNPDGVTKYDDLVESMDNLVEKGKIRYWGLSNHSGKQINELANAAESKKCSMVSGVECYYTIAGVGILTSTLLSKWNIDCDNLIGTSRIRWLEKETLPVINSRNIGLLAYSPMDQGYLSPGKEPDDNSPLHILLTTIDSIAMEVSVTRSQLCYAWVSARPEVTSVLGGPETSAQIDEAISGSSMILPTEILDALNKASYTYSEKQNN
jgi:aryl-alcohol dehydrogenase-like predicted oxidoreductase